MPVTDRNNMMGDAADDLPRTLRREREARERTQGVSSSSAPPMAPPYAPSKSLHQGALYQGDIAQPAIVTRFDVSFFRLMTFGFKLVFAAIPAVLLFIAILWAFGHVLMTYFPWLVKVQILIRVPN